MITLKRRYVYEDVDRWGNVRIYFWRGKGQRKFRAPTDLAQKHLAKPITVGFARARLGHLSLRPKMPLSQVRSAGWR